MDALIDWLLYRVNPFFIFVPFLVGLVALMLWLLTLQSNECDAEGGHLEVDYYMPISTGKTTTIMPVYKCEIDKDRSK